MFTVLIILGWVLGLAMGALSNPLIYKIVRGGRVGTADHLDHTAL